MTGIALQLRQPEVEQFHPSRLRDHDVAGFQIPMHHTLPVGLVQRVGNLDGVFECLIERQPSLFQPLLECLALDVLHDEVVNPVLFADVVERADVGVVQAADSSCFTLEAFTALGVGG